MKTLKILIAVVGVALAACSTALAHEGEMHAAGSGLFGLFKVHDEVPDDNADPVWYQNPSGTVSGIVPDADLKRDGIELPKDLSKAATRRTPKDEA